MVGGDYLPLQESMEVYQRVEPLRLATLKLYDWGELAANIPVSKLPSAAHPGVIILGGLAFILTVWGLWLCRRTLNSIDIYTFVYFVLLIFWPYRDARFWLPILPLAMAYVIKSLENILQFSAARMVVKAYVTAFSLLGVSALGHSSWVSLSGDNFPERYGDYSTRQTYEAAFAGTKAIDQDKVNCIGVRLLNRYEWRASHSCPMSSKP
jgi:hypothetical protein